MECTELQDFISKFKIGISFTAKVLLTNELGYIIVIQTARESFLTAQRIAILKNYLAKSIVTKFPDNAHQIHMILFNPKEWPFGIGKFKEEFTEDEVEDEIEDNAKKENPFDKYKTLRAYENTKKNMAYPNLRK